MANYCG